MIKNYKLGLKLLKYSYGIKQCVLIALLFFVIGLLLFMVNSSGFLGPLYLGMSAIYITQLLNTLNISSLVQSSSRKKALQTSIPVLVGLPVYLLAYGLTVVVEMLLLHTGKTQVQDIVGTLILVGLMEMWLLAYCGLAYKWFYASVIMFFGAALFVPSFQYLMEEMVLPHVSLWEAAVIGLMEILTGGCLQYLISRLTYRLPIARAAQMRTLQKYM